MRERICLNGEWRFMPDYHGRAPEAAVRDCRWDARPLRVPSSWRWSIEPGAPYQPYDLFGYPQAWNDAQSGVLGRSFSVRPRHAGREQINLVLNGVLQRSAVFVNDSKVAETSEGFLPIVADISDFVREGENDLKVWCGPFPSIETPVGPRNLAPDGSWWARMARGIWQDAFLEYRPAFRVEDIYVVTSTREQSIAVQVEVGNDAAGCLAAVRATVFDGLAPVKTLTSEAQRFPTGEVTTVRLAARWADAVWWSPERPHLYRVQVELIAGGQVMDRRETRFGFREVWLEGPDFMLNGTRVNLRGDAWHYQGFVQQTRAYAENWYKACRATGINCVRLHAMPYPEFYLDAADELGMLIMDESAIYGSSKRVQADHPDFIAQCRRHLRALVRRDRNHPSVIIWSAQNEMRWVDGRDGYKEAIPGLAQAMRELDGTRPISYDGDTRLLDPADLEIISVHYSLDGTVEGWQRDKPLMFGEHGKWHYVAPQVCCDLVGPAAYLSFNACQEEMGLEERLFIEHARREGVTGLCPFNMVNYMLATLPAADVPLTWADLTTPGVKPDRIPAHTLTVDNGLLSNHPHFIPNPAWRHVQAAFAPIAIIPDDYDTAFFGGRAVERSFSIYNDTERPAEARLTWRLTDASDACLASGETAFRQPAGERIEWRHSFALPDVAGPTECRLALALYHGDTAVYSRALTYRVHPQRDLTRPLDLVGRRAAYLGGPASLRVLTPLLPGLRALSAVGELLDDVDLLVIGKDYEGDAGLLQAWLEPFVARGGFLLMLEQSRLALGDLTLSGRAFHAAYRNEPDHPIFAGLTDDDMRFWSGTNPCRLDAAPLVFNAFEKPVQGDFRTLLECGGGDFGHGGLLWTALIEYRVGRGRALLCQAAVTGNAARVPAAATLLRNMLAYCIGACGSSRSADSQLDTLQPQAAPTGVILGDQRERGISFAAFLDAIGLEGVSAGAPPWSANRLVIADPAGMDAETVAALRSHAEMGGRVLVLPAAPEHAAALGALLGAEVAVESAEVYQVRPLAHELTRGISVHDLFHLEKINYAPPNKVNSLVARHALRCAEGAPLFADVHAPWRRYFVDGARAEYQKNAVANIVAAEPFEPRCFGLATRIGIGQVVVVQLLPPDESQRGADYDTKLRRVYARLLGNLGAEIRSPLFTYVKEAQDFSVPALMALLQAPHQDAAAMEAYFADPRFTLNTLGEGAYGWMRPAERQAGMIRVADSAGRTCFLILFVESDVNRDPTRRAADELPDSSIVPDLRLQRNCSARIYVNGRMVADLGQPTAGDEAITIPDVLLWRGLNRVALVCRGGAEDIRLNLTLLDKRGGPLAGIKYRLTLE